MKHNMKKKIRIKNWAEDLNRSLQRRYTDGQEAHEKMFSITSYERNANQNYNEVSLHTGQNGHYLKKKKKKTTINGGGLPWWLSGKDSICHCRRYRFNLLSGKIPHAMEQRSPCATTTEPVFWRPGAAITEPMFHNY